MLNILVTGFRGRMGQAVATAVSENTETRVAAGIDIGDSLEEALAKCDAVIDFTLPSFTNELIEGCVDVGKPLIMGTTGHDDAQLELIQRASESIPIIHAPNFSVGVNTLFWLTRRTAEILGEGFDLEVVEMHHRHKLDSPSGTARRLAEILTEVRNLSYDKDCRHGRFGDVGARTDHEVGVHALRGGDVVGDHTVIYAGNGERVELTHKASSRLTFAQGAVRAARWIESEGLKNGLFDMQDVLGLK
ncbi:MAG: 4-hydroxy-tetrahydrodipicolinate reductase [Verrucomicrobiales bacterium]|jgi:4-hydroxy-tetrahydrodipicolinate reductase|nr:4-hydroxy-tetrahydrodipicolinate reductase [Verrucomicrobiales bacterium]MDP5004487.1 4-hydroxy-tetrahydrodipicolinate reductase [Verrucomicrobiales bacterium]